MVSLLADLYSGPAAASCWLVGWVAAEFPVAEIPVESLGADKAVSRDFGWAANRDSG